MFPAPPHTFMQRCFGSSRGADYRVTNYRVLGWDERGNAITDRETDRSEVETSTIIPAAPGWFGLSWHSDPDPDPKWQWRLSKNPIVAWRVVESSEIYGWDSRRVSKHITTTAISCTNEEDENHKWELLSPDGYIYAFEEEAQPFEVWLAEKRANRSPKE